LHGTVDHLEKHRNALTLAPHELLLCGSVDYIDFAVTWRNDEVGSRWWTRLRVPEKIKSENCENNPNQGQERRNGQGDRKDHCCDSYCERPDAPNRQDGNKGNQNEYESRLSDFTRMFHSHSR